MAITNREKYIDDILATYLYNEYTDGELKSEYRIATDENGDITHYQVMKWLEAEYEEPKDPEIEYIEVTNDIPRFTEIEVRDSVSDEWEKKVFLFKRDEKKRVRVYMCLDECGLDAAVWRYARVRKDWENK